jgi:ABC-type transporter Mla MlaB component
MLRLTTHSLAGATVIRADGRLTGEAIDELLGLIGPDADLARFTLDLSGVTGVDARGLWLLADLRRAGCRLDGASLYVSQLLEEASS